MRNEELRKRKEEKNAEETKTCFDCLYCKVSATSLVKTKLCYCSKTVKRVKHKEAYWLIRKTCKKYEGMDEQE